MPKYIYEDNIKTKVQWFLSSLIINGLNHNKLLRIEFIDDGLVFHKTINVEGREIRYDYCSYNRDSYERKDLEFIDDINCLDFTKKLNESICCYVHLLDETYINNLVADWSLGNFMVSFISV